MQQCTERVFVIKIGRGKRRKRWRRRRKTNLRFWSYIGRKHGRCRPRPFFLAGFGVLRRSKYKFLVAFYAKVFFYPTYTGSMEAVSNWPGEGIYPTLSSVDRRSHISNSAAACSRQATVYVKWSQDFYLKHIFVLGGLFFFTPFLPWKYERPCSSFCTAQKWQRLICHEYMLAQSWFF